MKKIKNKKIYLIISVALILSALLISFYFQLLYQNNYNNYMNYKKENLEKATNSVVLGYTDFSDFIYRTILNYEGIRQMLYEANIEETSTDEIRNVLYEDLSGFYDTVTGYSYRQLQFHDENGASFLRFNAPEKYGDDLTGVRLSMNIVEKEHREVSGFEAGRFVDGYRFIYPLFYNDEYVGSVELEISMSMVMARLYSSFENKDMGFIVDKEHIDNVLFEEGQSNYSSSYFSDSFYSDREVNEYFAENVESPKLYKNSDLLDIIKDEIEDKLNKKESFSTSVSYEGKTYLIQFNEVRDISGEFAGYIFLMGEDIEFEILLFARNSAITGTFIMLIFMLFALYLLYRKDKKIIDLALVDQLTQLRNRRSFYDLAESEKNRASRSKGSMYIAMLDIDHFKQVNDRYGHTIGDAVLKKVAFEMNSEIRKIDIIARFGGEEFVILMPDTDKNTAYLVAERVRKRIEKHNFDQVGKVTVSIGVAKYNVDEKIDTSIDRADKALYKAKASGRNQVIKAWELKN